MCKYTSKCACKFLQVCILLRHESPHISHSHVPSALCKLSIAAGGAAAREQGALPAPSQSPRNSKPHSVGDKEGSHDVDLGFMKKVSNLGWGAGLLLLI